MAEKNADVELTEAVEALEVIEAQAAQAAEAQATRKKRSGKLTKVERSWVKYDVGNSAMFMLSTALIPIFFNTMVAEAGLGEGSFAMIAWSYAMTIATLIVALLMPFFGSVADFEGNKKKFFIGFCGTGCVATILLGIPQQWLAFLVVYVIAMVCLNSSLVFYDSFLIDATTDERMDEVSAKGYAWGYIGSCAPFIVCVAVYATFSMGILPISFALMKIICFVITAVWWFLFAIPLIRNVHQTHSKPRVDHPFSRAFHGLAVTLKEIAHNKSILLFLIAFFFYIDGVHTIISLATSYGADLGIDSIQLVLALLVTQFVAFPSAIAYGKLCGRVGTRKMIMVGIIAYICITLFAGLFLKSAVEFWILAVAVGLFQGGIQATSRSYFGKLIPKEKSNEYFGFFDIFGKYAAVLGTFLVGFFTQMTGNGSIGVLSISLLLILGLIFFIKSPDPEKKDK